MSIASFLFDPIDFLKSQGVDNVSTTLGYHSLILSHWYKNCTFILFLLLTILYMQYKSLPLILLMHLWNLNCSYRLFISRNTYFTQTCKIQGLVIHVLTKLITAFRRYNLSGLYKDQNIAFSQINYVHTVIHIMYIFIYIFTHTWFSMLTILISIPLISGYMHPRQMRS